MKNNSYLSNYMALDIIRVVKDFLWIYFNHNHVVFFFHILEGKSQPMLNLQHVRGIHGNKIRLTLFAQGGGAIL